MIISCVFSSWDFQWHIGAINLLLSKTKDVCNAHISL